MTQPKSFDPESLWLWIDDGACYLPHKIEWQEGNHTASMMHTMFVIPAHIVQLFSQSFDLYGRCEALANRRQCRFFKAKSA
jgi:hypothetical protein